LALIPSPVARKGVRVDPVCPGPVDTPMIHSLEAQSVSGQQPGLGAGCRDWFDGSSVEAGEDRSAEPGAFEGDDAVCEISAGLERGEASIDGRSVHPDIGTIDQTPDCGRDRPTFHSVSANEHPDELAKRRQRHCDNFCPAEGFCRQSRLIRIVIDSCADKDVCVGGDPQRPPAHPRAAISAISPVERGFDPRWRR